MPTSSVTDLPLSTATYLGGSGVDQGHAVAIQPSNSVIVGGVFSGLPPAGADRALLGAAANAPGSILHFNADGTVLQSITRLGNAVDDVDVASDGRILAAGDFGLAMLSADGSTVLWSESGGGIGESGAAVYSSGRRVSVGSDGTVAAIFNGYAYLFDSDGNSLGVPLQFRGSGSLIGGGLYNHRAEDIVVDGDNQRILVAGWSQTSAGVQTPWIQTYDYTNAAAISDWATREVWRNYRWWASALSGSLTADSRIKRISQGEDGSFYFVGNADGGNTVFQRNPKYLDASHNRGADVISQTVNNVGIDRWNNGAGASVGAFGYFARINEGNGELPVAQFQYSSAGVNEARSFRIEAITADASGNTYIGGQSSAAMPDRDNLHINGAPIGPRVPNETSLIGVANDFASRVQLGSFTATGGAPGTITALASGGGRLVILGNTTGDIVTVSPLDGSRDGEDVFFAVTGSPPPPVPGFNLSKATVTLSETGSDDFVITLDVAPASAVTFNIFSNDSGEVAPTPTTVTLDGSNWNTGQTVTLNGVTDGILDGNQTSTITVRVDDANSDDSFDPLADQTVTVTTLDSDQPPPHPDPVSVSINDVAETEGDSGTTAFSFTLALDKPATEEVTVIVNTQADSATSGDDFTALVDQQITVPTGATSVPVVVQGIGDTAVEADETFLVNLADARLGGVSDGTLVTISDGQGQGTILNDDTPPPADPHITPLPNRVMAISNGNPLPLKVALTKQQAGKNGTIIMAVVDDAEGTVDGKRPGDAGYQEAVRRRSMTVLSSLSGQEFGHLGFERILNLGAAQFLQFGLIQGNTLDDLRYSGIGDVLWGLATANGGGQSPLLANQITPSKSMLSFRLPDGDEVDDFTLTIALENATPTLGSQLQGMFSESELLDLTGIADPTVNARFTVYREADYDNTVFFYTIHNPQGDVVDPLTGNLVSPGEADYLRMAVANRVDMSLTGSNGRATQYTAALPTGQLLSTFLVVDSSLQPLLDSDPSNDPTVYFNHIAANGDGKDHVRLLGDNLFGYEDLPGGGDMDFDDVIVRVELAA